MRMNTRVLAAAIGALVAASPPSVAGAQWSTTYDQFYYPGSFNWQFRKNYPPADRLFNAFDFGHAILYETLWTDPGAPAAELEEKWYDRLTKEILVNPPPVPLEESAIEIAYAKLAPEAKQMFDWAHLLHRQIYDVWADERIPAAGKDALVAKLIRYYKSRPDLAFSSKPKSMELMEGMPYSTAFRTSYPKFNGLIWAYHWLQVGLYEPLVTGANKDERQTGVIAAVARFRHMIEDPPTWMPRVMPMTAAIAPAFTTRYPEAAIIFDNLHSMHDVVSDILANPAVPRNHKRAEILLAARRYRDDTSYVMTEQAWREMSVAMGGHNMGGPVMGVLEPFPTPTVARGAVMAGMDHTQHAAQPTPNTDEHAGHDMPADTTRAARDTTHDLHAMHTAPVMPDDSAAVARVVTAYHAALAAGDSSAALALLAPDAVILESGGIESREEYRGHHLPADIAFASAVPSERSAIRVVVRGDMAWASSTSTSKGTFRGRAINSRGAELMVLRREGSQWLIQAIHWSSGPVR